MNSKEISCQKYVFYKMNAIHPLSWSCQSNLHLRSAIKNISQPLDGTYLADFGIDIKANLPKKNEERGQELGQKLSDFDFL